MIYTQNAIFTVIRTAVLNTISTANVTQTYSATPSKFPTVFAREIEFMEEMEESSKTNQIYLDGYICKEPIYRKTPLGREIADLLLAVNRPYGKSDYIPCICWGRNARYANNFHVGTRCEIWGRIQSREYMKKISEDELEKRIAYEVSVSKLELFEE